MPETIFPRSGASPLVAECEIIAQESSRTEHGFSASHWHEITLALTPAGQWVVGCCKRSTKPQEPTFDWATYADTPGEVIAALRSYDPLEHIKGLPPGDRFSGPQLKLQAQVQSTYYAAVDRVIAAASAQMGERVD